MGGVPGNKIVQFEMGNLSQEFPTEVDLIVEEACQIRYSPRRQPASPPTAG